MLTAKKLSQIILELQSLDDIGCTYDFKERLEVSFSSIETLGLVTKIQRKIPACDDHCSKSSDCQWIPIFQKSKSRSKFKLTKLGKDLAEKVANKEHTDEELKRIIHGFISKSIIIDTVQSMIIDQNNLTTEKIVTGILNHTNIKLQIIRTALKDIFDLMENLEIIRIKEGLLSSYG
ncbi:MAG: hypothetical protein FK730_10520 [Asgard group archaeon]|nr:hypothetical protein [Asgard group archaeon]